MYNTTVEKQTISFLQKLIQTPSVNGKKAEEEVVGVIAREADKLKLPFQVYESEKGRPNIFVGEDFNSNKNMLLVAHTDTVPPGDERKWTHPPFAGNISNNKIYGRGAIDCKGGIATSIYTIKNLYDQGHKRLAKFVGVADEESGANSRIGLRYLLQKGLNAKGAVYTYGAKITDDTLTIGHRGLIRLWVTCHGESAHSGSLSWQQKKAGESAIEGICKFLKESKHIKFSQTNKYFPKYKYIATPTIIEGGNSESIVPTRARVLIDIRTLPNNPQEEIIKKYNKLAKQLSGNKRSYEIKIKTQIPASLTNPDSKIISCAKDLYIQLKGKSPKLTGSGPANEGYMLINKNIPTIIGFGPIGNGFHSPDEYAEIDSLPYSIDFLTKLAIKLSSC